MNCEQKQTQYFNNAATFHTWSVATYSLTSNKDPQLMIPADRNLDLSKVELTNFAERHFDPTFTGTKIPRTVTQFMTSLTSPTITADAITYKDPTKPFLKLVVIPNFTDCKAGTVPITDANRHLLQTVNSVRRDGETSYQQPFFSSVDVDPPTATHLHLILYSAGQLAREGITLSPSSSHGIVSINAEMVGTPIPPTPATIERNEAGLLAGGNGATYSPFEKAVAASYHASYANVR